MRDKLIKIARECIEAVKGEKLIENAIKIDQKHIEIMGQLSYDLSKYKFLIIGFGKAVLSIGLALEQKIKKNLLNGILIIPMGSKESHQTFKDSKLQIYEGAKNNIPDENAANATRQLVKLVEDIKNRKNVVVFVLISGGGSALLTSPVSEISLEEKIDLIKKLSLSGASIVELNTVRKALSNLKGGGLADILYPMHTVGLIVSDVINNPIDFIASGPLSINRDDITAPMKILEKYLSNDSVPNSIRNVLRNKKIKIQNVEHVSNFIIGSNRIALEKGAMYANENFQFQSQILSYNIEGNVHDIGLKYVKLTTEIVRRINKIHSTDIDIIFNENIYYDKPIFIIAGGETTVRVLGKGKGGRCQELALIFATELDKLMYKQNEQFDGIEIYFLSCGTDGIDGPTDVSGAIVYKGLIQDAKNSPYNLDPVKFLHENDSYNFFRLFNNGKSFVKFGHTGVNVMDLQILLINKYK